MLVKKGDRLKYVGAGRALPFQVKRANKLLNKKTPYIVQRVYEDEWGIYVYLEGIERRSFPLNLFTPEPK